MESHKDNSIREDLAFTYRLFARNGWDDLTYTHLTVRSRQGDSFYIIKFGLLFDEVTPDNLIQVDFNGRVIDGKEEIFNPTGYTIHSSVYKARPDINAIFHSHMVPMISVGSMPQGLLPVSQWALHFYDKVSYHEYDSLALDLDIQGNKIANDLGENSVLMMRNHGVLVCGVDLPEAYYFHHHLNQACQLQCQLLATGAEYVSPDHDHCVRTRQDLLGFEIKNGHRDWQALRRYHKDLFRKRAIEEII